MRRVDPAVDDRDIDARTCGAAPRPFLGQWQADRSDRTQDVGFERL